MRHAQASGRGRKCERARRDGHAVGAQLLRARDDRGALEQVQGDLDDGAVGRARRGTIPRPSVEGAHRRAAPDLVVGAAVRVAVDRPAAGLAEVPAEHQRHLVLRVALGAGDLGRVALRARSARVSPRPRRAWRGARPSRAARAARRGSVVERRRGCGRPRRACAARGREHRAALQHLHLHAHLEHVGGRRHHHVGVLGLGEHPLAGLREPRLDGGLVDRAGEHVGGAERERRGDAPRRAEPAGRADPDRPRVAVTRRELVAQREDRRAAARPAAGCRCARRCRPRR